MRILVGHNGNVDFDEPVRLTAGQRTKFLAFMKSMFLVVETEEGEEIRADRLGDRMFMREWSSRELRYLLSIEDTETRCRALGRSWMSVDLKSGEFIPEFLEWAHAKGYDILKKDAKKLIGEFLEEKRILIDERKRDRKAQRQRLKQLEIDLERKNDLIKATELRIRCGQGKPSDDKLLEETRKEISEIEMELAGEDQE